MILIITLSIKAQPTDCQSDRYQQKVFNNIQITSDITYGSAPNITGFTQSLELDFYEPAPSEEYLGKRPLAVMFFGGAYLLGSKQDADMRAWCDSLAHFGYVCASVEYRLDNAAHFALPNQGVRAAYRAIQDGRAAIRYLLDDPNGLGFNIDPDHIYVGGESAGAITAIHIAYMEESERPTETFNVGFFDPDMGCIDCSGNNINQPFSIAGVIDLWGATLDLNYLDVAENIPMVMIHGDQDFIVPYTSGSPFNVPLFPNMYGSVPIAADLTAKGICHQFYSYPGEGHVFYGIPSGVVTFPNQYWEPVFTQGHEFLYDKTMVYDSPSPTGLLAVCEGATETYEVPANADSQFCWDVVNGTIISTNNNQVTVQWNNSNGYLTVTEANCIDVIGTPQTIEVVPSACCAGVDLSIFFDGFPGQTSWDITDANSAVVASGGSYGGVSGNTTTTESDCLPDGCYTLNFYDALNNGMCPFRANAAATGTFITSGTTIIAGSIVASFGLGVTPGLCGNYKLRDSNGTILVSGGGGFGAQQNSTFCLSGGVAAKTTNNTNAIELERELLMVYPTLANNFVNLAFGFAEETEVKIAIYDVSGKLVEQFHNLVVSNWETLQLDVSQIENGCYFIQVLSDEGAVTKRFIKH